jgi:hypothetical protein
MSPYFFDPHRAAFCRRALISRPTGSTARWRSTTTRSICSMSTRPRTHPALELTCTALCLNLHLVFHKPSRSHSGPCISSRCVYLLSVYCFLCSHTRIYSSHAGAHSSKKRVFCKARGVGLLRFTHHAQCVLLSARNAHRDDALQVCDDEGVADGRVGAIIMHIFYLFLKRRVCSTKDTTDKIFGVEYRRYVYHV